MKLKLNKKKLKNLSKDSNLLPENFTPQVAGGRSQQLPPDDFTDASCVANGCFDIKL